jgi:CHAT domain-containing protein
MTFLSRVTATLSRGTTFLSRVVACFSRVTARSVAKLLGGDCVLRVGPEAREAELKAAVSPRVLHLATHGFFLSDQDFKRANALRDVRIGNSGTRWNASLPKDEWENPLVQCGIALAGANHEGQITNAAAEDGLLIGLEASLLNLQGTEPVILSACDSGTGEVQIGEERLGSC